MAKIQKEIPVKLIVGFIFLKEETLKKAIKNLSRKFGEVDFESQSFVFNFTTYYEKELGRNLKRKFVSFKRLVSPARLALVKHFTNKLEKQLSNKAKRQINIDPGYVNASKLILATTKDFAHRIYLSQGIFAEVTLEFRGKSFTSGERTYPDYRTQPYIQIFNQIRLNYLRQLKAKSHA